MEETPSCRPVLRSWALSVVPHLLLFVPGGCKGVDVRWGAFEQDGAAGTLGQTDSDQALAPSGRILFA